MKNLNLKFTITKWCFLATPKLIVLSKCCLIWIKGWCGWQVKADHGAGNGFTCLAKWFTSVSDPFHSLMTEFSAPAPAFGAGAGEVWIAGQGESCSWSWLYMFGQVVYNSFLPQPYERVLSPCASIWSRCWGLDGRSRGIMKLVMALHA